MEYWKVILFWLWINTFLQLSESCSDGRFGANCQFQCHCRLPGGCEQTTGQCQNGLCEAGWMGSSCQYRNIAYGKKVLQTGTDDLGGSVTDGVNLPFINNGTCSTTNMQNQPKIQIQFGRQYRVDALRLFFPHERLTEMNGFVIAVGRNLCYRHSGPVSAFMEIECRHPTSAYFIYIAMEGMGRLSICEVEVYQGRNVAFGKPTSQSSNYTDAGGQTFLASLAVDGSYSVASADITCTSTQVEYRPWWMMDLGMLYKVSGVNIYMREKWPGQLARFQAFLGNTTDIEAAKLIHEDNQNIPSKFTSITLSQVEVGRYFFVRLPGQKRSLSLCEVQVFGDCPDFLCGLECEIPCPCYNPAVGSKKVDGICSSGCEDGWTTEDTGTCARGSCSKGEFGPDCEHGCHCFTECNPLTGVCLGGPDFCQPAWDGPFCQRENFALKAKAKLRNSGFEMMLPKLTDGDVESCLSQSTDNLVATFSVELAVERKIRNITIYKTASTEDIKLEVFVGQTRNNRRQCSAEILTHQIQADCGGEVNKYIFMRQERSPTETQTYFQLCEVEAYECANGSFGMLCDKFCHCEHNAPCDKEFGRCPSQMCHPGWQGLSCGDKCLFGTYGMGCLRLCIGHCKHGTVCDHIDGTCPAACQDGWQGTHCNRECNYGHYGQHCESSCGLCKNGASCNSQTGVCDGGCGVGKRTDLCNQDCLDGDFGEDCKEDCGNCYQNSPCDKISGTCLYGCWEGWQGVLCKTECRNGRYGRNCSKECGHCHDNMPCDVVTGKCFSGCSAGWSESNCDVECRDGTFGLRCASFCGHCTGDHYCDKVNGTCGAGCEPGWKYPHCSQVCEDRRYGKNCQGICGHCRNGSTCHKQTGICNGGCEIGWTNSQCYTKCPSGYYGDKCGRHCSSHCKQKSCDHVIGECSIGCEPGWNGSYCSQECEPSFYGDECKLQCLNCLDKNCSHINGSCVRGCVDGMAGHDCAQKQEAPPSLKTKIGAIVLGIFVAIVVIILLLVLYLCRQGHCHRLVQEKNNRKSTGNYPNMTMSAVQSDQQENNYGISGNSLDISNAPTVVDPNRSMLGGSMPLHFQYDNHGYQDGESMPSFKSFSSNNTHMSLNDEHDRVSLLSNNKNVYGNVSTATRGPCGAVAVENLRETIQQKLTDSCCLPTEFMSFTSDLAYPCNEAMKQENCSKNRYKKIYPYDHNRVILLNPHLSQETDYINASYIDGFHQRRSYVAAQGPIEATRGDFWRMVWQLDVGKIVMLTGLVEAGRVKCQQYWPDEGEEVFAGVNVRIVSCDMFAEFDTRTFEIHAENSEARTVKQFHFTSWPDMDVPEKASTMVHFWNAVRTSDVEATGPVVVHCSAGIGRTGTFLALDYLVDEARANNYVQIVGCVQNLRFQRVNMIQTETQYRYLHDVLAEALTSSDSSISAENFIQAYQELFNQDDVEGKTKLEIEFENLQIECLPPGDEEFTSAKDPRNQTKNRNSSILASDNYRPYLHTPGLDSTNYINAVFLPGYRSRNAYIVTQMPLPDTVVDLWRLVYEQGIQTIIKLNHTDIFNIETGVYWPEGENQEEYGPFMVVVLGCECTLYGTILTLSLTYSRVANSTPQIIHLYQYNSVWQDDKPIPMSPTAFLQLLQEIQHRQVESSKTPIIVQCSDGAERSGLYCVLSSVIDRLQAEEKVDIRETVKLYRCRRQAVVATLAQYRFCHAVILEYLQSIGEDTFATRF